MKPQPPQAERTLLGECIRTSQASSHRRTKYHMPCRAFLKQPLQPMPSLRNATSQSVHGHFLKAKQPGTLLYSSPHDIPTPYCWYSSSTFLCRPTPSPQDQTLILSWVLLQLSPSGLPASSPQASVLQSARLLSQHPNMIHHSQTPPWVPTASRVESTVIGKAQGPCPPDPDLGLYVSILISYHQPFPLDSIFWVTHLNQRTKNMIWMTFFNSPHNGA